MLSAAADDYNDHSVICYVKGADSSWIHLTAQLLECDSTSSIVTAQVQVLKSKCLTVTAQVKVLKCYSTRPKVEV